MGKTNINSEWNVRRVIDGDNDRNGDDESRSAEQWGSTWQWRSSINKKEKKLSSNRFQRWDGAVQNDRLAMFKDEQCDGRSKVTDDEERLLRKVENRMDKD